MKRHWGRGLRVHGRIVSIPEVRIWPFFVGLFIFLIAIAFLTVAVKADEASSKPACVVEELSTRVLFFPCRGRSFAEALAYYMETHSRSGVFADHDIRIQHMEADSHSGGTTVILR